MRLSPDGVWLALTWYGPGQGIEMNEGKQLPEETFNQGLHELIPGLEVLLVNTVTGDMIRPFKNFSTSAFPVWSSDGKSLALLVQDGFRRYLRIAIWSPKSAELQVFDQALSSTTQPQWTDDGKYVLFSFLPKKNEPTVTEAVTGTDPGSENSFGCLGMLNPNNGYVTTYGHLPIRKCLRLSPDGQHVAFLSSVPSKSKHTQDTWVQLSVADLGDGTGQLIGDAQAESLGLWRGAALSWAPDGKSIAWRTQPEEGPNKLFVGDVAKGILTECPLPKDADAGNLYLCALPLWSRDSQSFLVPGQNKLLRFTLNGAAQGEIPLPVLKRGGADWLIPGMSSAHGPVCPGDNQLLILRHHEIDQLHLQTGTIEKICSGTSHEKLSNKFRERAFDIKTRMLYTVYTGEENNLELMKTHFPDGTISHLCTLFPGLGKTNYGAIKSLSWKLTDGKKYGGTLLLPIGWKSEDKPPVVMWVYGDSLGNAHLDAAKMAKWTTIINPHFLSVRGYAYFMPDMPQNDAEPAASLVTSGKAAVAALRQSGLVDAERVALIGQSYGAYTVVELLTHSKIFKAGIACNGDYDLVRSATDGEWGWAESGQGRMHASLWEQPQRYMDNSPLYALSKLDAPLLIVHGCRDPLNAQSRVIFNSLQRLSKHAKMVAYRRGGHDPGTWPIDDQRDLSRRVLEFLNEQLPIASPN